MITKEAVDLIKVFESCVLHAYLCPAGVWTIGYGHTGPDVKKGMIITQADAERILDSDLKIFSSMVTPIIKVPINENQFSALVSFAFNAGVYALEKSTLLRMLNKGDISGAAAQFERWVYADGKVLPGLVRRRKAERALFEKEVDGG